MQNGLVLVGRLIDAMEVYQSNRPHDSMWYYDWQGVAIAFGMWSERQDQATRTKENFMGRVVKAADCLN